MRGLGGGANPPGEPLGPPAGAAAIGSCMSGSLVAAGVRGLCTVLVTNQVWFGDVGGRLPIVAHTIEDSGLALKAWLS